MDEVGVFGLKKRIRCGDDNNTYMQIEIAADQWVTSGDADSSDAENDLRMESKILF